MKGKTTGVTSRAKPAGRTDLARLRDMRDDDIDYSDIPALTEDFWQHAKLTLPQAKDRLTLRLDHDVVVWLKRQGKGYQTRINAILRAYMKAHEGKKGRDNPAH